MNTETELCYHCGEKCPPKFESFDAKSFCCSGCLSVYQLLNRHDLLQYYCITDNPGVRLDEASAEDKFKFLEIDSIVQQLIKFRNVSQTKVEFYLPQIHCSSCLWLLEHLDEIHEGILHTQVNFTSKRILIHFEHDKISIKEVAILLSSIGYEPLIDLYQPEQKRLTKKYNSKSAYLKIGVAAFCFSNIMLISFPEYLGLNPQIHPSLSSFFKWVCLLLSLPVVFYSAREFFENSYYSFRQKYVNIDVPIALAITVTFLRSVYEVVSGTGVGFFDSMTGIVFFMLLGRTLQNRTYTTLSFNKDVKSYFPLAVTRVLNGNERENVRVQDIEENDVLFIHTHEVIPTDCILSKGSAVIDYSFITGESMPESVDKGSIIYAGGKNVGSSIEVLVLKSFSDNSFNQLWNNNQFKENDFEKESVTTAISRYFSYVVILISLAAFVYWQFRDPSVSWNAATAVLIIACPCALLLTASFTQGYLLEILSRHGIFFKNADVIEKLTKITHVAFDKTGTLTNVSAQRVVEEFNELNREELEIVLSAMQQSSHPLSQTLVKFWARKIQINYKRFDLKENPGKGLEFELGNVHWKVGSKYFVTGKKENKGKTQVYVGVDGQVKAIFTFNAALLEGVPQMLKAINKDVEMSLISGDNSASHHELSQFFSSEYSLKFDCAPEDKLEHIKQLQSKGHKVMMVGDGINDAAALRQSDVGVTLVKESFSFSPASDIIMEDSHVKELHNIIRLNKASMLMVWLGFGYSIIFNLIGIYYSVTGQLSPLIAAILMPSSSLGIILIAYVGMRIVSKSFLTKMGVHEPLPKADKNHILT